MLRRLSPRPNEKERRGVRRRRLPIWSNGLPGAPNPPDGIRSALIRPLHGPFAKGEGVAMLGIASAPDHSGNVLLE